MRRWSLALLDEPTSDQCNNAECVIERHVPSMGVRSSADVVRVAAISRDSGTNPRNRINPVDVETDRRVYVASSRIEPHEIEWARLDSVDGEICKFGSGELMAPTTRNNPKRCYRTSISSGYSSHSSPLSAGSYSYYASASASTRDPSWYGDLAVIHETETIPRPIWPSALYHHAEDCNIDYEDIYTCHACGCTYGYPPLTTPLPATRASTREMLLQLSRTLNSVIDGDAVVALEDILRDISCIVPLGTGIRNDNVYEYVYPSWTFSDTNLSVSPNFVKNVPSRATSVDPKLHVAPRYFYGYNSMRSVPLLKNGAKKTTRCEKNNKENSSSLAKEKSYDTEKSNPHVCKYLHGRHDGNSCTKQSFRSDGDPKRCRNSRASTESIHPIQLEGSDIGSSSEGTTASLNGTDWNRSIRGLREAPDFTLDVTRAERLGRTIARAKRKRQWCRILTTLFGLVFFILSVVVVSLSVTRGRKVFGSM